MSELGPTEAATVESAQSGDLEALHSLVSHYSTPLYRLAFRITRSPADAEDAVQDAFLKAYQKLETYRAQAGFGTWIYRIATNTALDLVRRRQRQDRDTDALGPLDTTLKGNDPDPERRAQGREIEGRLNEAMDMLTAIERTAFVLRHFEGRTTVEIGEVLGVAPNTAKQTVFRAVRKIRTALEPIVRSAS